MNGLPAATPVAGAGLRRILPPPVRRLARHLRRGIFDELELVIIERALGGAGRPSPAALTLRAVEEGDFESLAAFCRIHRGVEIEAISRLYDFQAMGYPGFLAAVDGALLGYVWWVDAARHARAPHPRVRRLGIEIGERTVYLFDFFVAPQFRGKGISLAFLGIVHSQLRSLGFQRAVGDVDANDLRARWTYRVDGWTDVQRVRVFTLCSRILIHPGGWSVRDPRWL
jgi:GNAT superfamily N-acetyltransferase